MSPQDRMMLTNELNTLNSRIAVCGGLLQAARASAGVPVVVPPTGGAFPIPALDLICQSLQQQQEALTSTAKLMEKIIARA